MNKTELISEMFRPPINRAMRELDRSFFQRKIPLAAAKVYENEQISRCRNELGRDLLQLEHVAPVRPDPTEGVGKKNGRKLLLLRPEIRPEDPSTWTTKLQRLIEENKVALAPYELTMDYDSWTYRTHANPYTTLLRY
jgi:tRNA (guanine37-N1)-methyltransferase